MDDWESEANDAALLAQRDDVDVADDWEAEVDEEAASVAAAAAPKAPKAAPKPKPSAAAAYVDPFADETPQERRARLDALEKQRDLENAMDLFGMGAADGARRTDTAAVTVSASPFDTMRPTTVAEFDAFARVVLKRMEALEAEGSPHYGSFVEGLVNGLMARREPAELRKVSGYLSDLASRRAKEQAAARMPKASAAKAPAIKAARKAGGTLGRFNDCLDADAADPFGD